MAAAHMEHVVGQVRTRRVVGDHREAVGRIRAGICAMSVRSMSVVGVTESWLASSSDAVTTTFSFTEASANWRCRIDEVSEASVKLCCSGSNPEAFAVTMCPREAPPQEQIRRPGPSASAETSPNFYFNSTLAPARAAAGIVNNSSHTAKNCRSCGLRGHQQSRTEQNTRTSAC